MNCRSLSEMISFHYSSEWLSFSVLLTRASSCWTERPASLASATMACLMSSWCFAQLLPGRGAAQRANPNGSHGCLQPGIDAPTRCRRAGCGMRRYRAKIARNTASLQPERSSGNVRRKAEDRRTAEGEGAFLALDDSPNPKNRSSPTW